MPKALAKWRRDWVCLRERRIASRENWIRYSLLCLSLSGSVTFLDAAVDWSAVSAVASLDIHDPSSYNQLTGSRSMPLVLERIPPLPGCQV
ncbi:MAG: hypothetical protein O3C21_12120 [Verrucomicrobia bacterium]|nr:hypothetical protein [Verrucomicrobiota bacterium]